MFFRHKGVCPLLCLVFFFSFLLPYINVNAYINGDRPLYVVPYKRYKGVCPRLCLPYKGLNLGADSEQKALGL